MLDKAVAIGRADEINFQLENMIELSKSGIDDDKRYLRSYLIGVMIPRILDMELNTGCVVIVSDSSAHAIVEALKDDRESDKTVRAGLLSRFEMRPEYAKAIQAYQSAAQ